MRTRDARSAGRDRRLPAVVVLAAMLTLLAVPQPAGAADSGTEAQFVARVNSIRESKGIAPLTMHDELHAVARRWTDQMVANGHISHNPNLASEVSGDWTKLGENVGVGGDVDSLMRAFVNSPAHYRNIVDPAYSSIGVGVTYDADGRLYTTHDFMAVPEESSPPTGSPSGDAAQTPRPTDDLPAGPAPPTMNPSTAPTTPSRVVRMHIVLTALRVAGP